MRSDVLTRAEECRARSIYFHALSVLLQTGNTGPVRKLLANNGVISLPPRPADLDDELAEHYRLFGRNIIPYASAYVEPGGQLGGIVSDCFLAWYDLAAWNCDTLSEAPDHFGIQFEFLSFISDIEARTVEAGNSEAANHAAQACRHFVTNYLLPAWPPFIAAVTRATNELYPSVMSTGIQLAIAHVRSAAELEDFGVKHLRHETRGADPVELLIQVREGENIDLNLDEPRTSLRDVADYLTSCRRSGAFISQTDLAAAGKHLDIPRGFGSRSVTLENMLRTASALDELGGLITDLKLIYETALDKWLLLVEPDWSPPFSTITEYYANRIHTTVKTLDRIVRVRDGLDKPI